MSWTVKVGQGTNIRTLKRISNITVIEEWAHSSFSITIQNPTNKDRDQAKGRIDDAIIQIKRGFEILLEGYIEDVEKGPNYVKYTGRSFLILLGYSTSSETDKETQKTKAEYTNEYAKDIIEDLIENYCYTKDSELNYNDIIFKDESNNDIEYNGTLKLHGKKVYDIICDMCNMYAKDIWSDATWNENNVENKNIHIGIKGNGDSENPHKKLYAGIHFKEMPVVKYRTQSDMINCLRVIGKGTGKDRISVWCEDSDSILNYGYIEGQPYISNLIVDNDTATKVGNAIINDKKELVEQLYIDLIFYINNLKYGDWVQIIDSYSNIDTIKRIKKITKIYDSKIGDSMQIEVGSMFNNYEKIIQDLTKKDVDSEIEMTRFGGSLKATANDPPDDFIRIDGGNFYDSTGTLQTAGNGICTFWTGSGSRILPPGSHNPGDGNYKKALIEIKDEDLTVWYHVGTEYGDINNAKNENVPVDSGFTPICEVILKGKGSDQVHPLYDKEYFDTDCSFIYRDCRPIVGASSSGYGSESLWESDGNETQLKNATSINMQSGSPSYSYEILNCGGIDLYNNNSEASPKINFLVPYTGEGSTGDYIYYNANNTRLELKTQDNILLFVINDEGNIKINKGSQFNFDLSSTAYIYQNSTNNNLMFKDPNIASEISLSDLITKEGLWEDKETYVQLFTPKNVSLKNYNIKDVLNIYAIDSTSTTRDFSILSSTGTIGFNITFTNNSPSAIDMYANLNMHNKKITGLLSGNASGEAMEYGQFDTWRNNVTQTEMGYLCGVTSSIQNQLDNKLENPLTNDLNMDEHKINNIKELNFINTLSYAYINFDSNNDYLRYNCINDIFEFKINNYLKLSIGTEYITFNDVLNINGYNIENMSNRYGKLNTPQNWYYNSSGSGIVKKIELNGVYFNLFCKLNMNGNAIYLDTPEDNTCKIWKNGNDLMFMDANNSDGISLSDIGLWEGIGSTLQPKGYDIIQGRSGHDLTIKPASGHILYLG